MTEKRCTDCKYTKGIGYDFWCGEGHTEYEVFGAETNCPYYEYHDWSKGTPSRTEKEISKDIPSKTEKEIVTLNQKQLDFLIHCIAMGLSMTHRYPLMASREIESYIQDTLKGLRDSND